MRPHPKTIRTKWGGGVAQVVESLLCTVLSSNLSFTNMYVCVCMYVYVHIYLWLAEWLKW
jgi:hypothetical protein